MAYPPPTLPTNRSNATAQQDTHPADHNAIGGAVNDIVAKIGQVDAALAAVNTDLDTDIAAVNARIDSVALLVPNLNYGRQLIPVTTTPGSGTTTPMYWAHGLPGYEGRYEQLIDCVVWCWDTAQGITRQGIVDHIDGTHVVYNGFQGWESVISLTWRKYP